MKNAFILAIASALAYAIGRAKAQRELSSTKTVVHNVEFALRGAQLTAAINIETDRLGRVRPDPALQVKPAARTTDPQA